MKRLLVKLLGEATLNEVVKNLFNVTSFEDVLQYRGGSWQFMGKPMSDQQKSLLVAETQQFSQSYLWRVLKIGLKYETSKKMFEQSQTKEDLIAGKLMLWIINDIDRVITEVSKIK